MPIVEVIETPAHLRSLRAEWDELLSESDNDLPFLLPEWMDAWWDHWRHEGRVHDRLAARVVRSGGRAIALVPLMATRRGVGPLGTTELSLLGADPYITELRTPVVRRGHEEEAARALAAHLLEAPGWDWIHWTGLVRGGAFASALERAMPMEWTTELSAHVLPLAPTWDAFRAGLKRNIKESLRHCTNSLKRDGHAARLEVARTPAEVAAALPTFFALHTLRSQAKDAAPHPDRFAPPKARRFLEDVTARLAERGHACVFVLKVGDAAVAARVGFVLPRGLYLYFSGFDPAWSKYSVATTIVAESIRWAIGEKLEWVHLSTGTDVSKLRWGPRETIFRDAVTVAPHPWSRAAHATSRALRHARRDPRFAAVVHALAPVRTHD